ncbi:MAG: TetR/AcrR family transcriptional regulator [Mariprofundaceae bacterium]|nr:TetR/AcrR family transcriptional regulator [Mariprofundaceae bacterium]
MTKSKRDILIETAYLLFYEKGFHATGLAEILATASVAKGTLYQHFKSKDALIEAVLEHEGEKIHAVFVEAVERSADTPRDRLLAIFDVQHALWLRHRGFLGCPFIRAAGEYVARNHPVHQIAAMNKRLFMGYFRELATAAGAHDPRELARQLALLFEGAVILTHVSGEPDAAVHARRAASVLIDAALAAPAKGHIRS